MYNLLNNLFIAFLVLFLSTSIYFSFIRPYLVDDNFDCPTYVERESEFSNWRSPVLYPEKIDPDRLEINHPDSISFPIGVRIPVQNNRTLNIVFAEVVANDLDLKHPELSDKLVLYLDLCWIDEISIMKMTTPYTTPVREFKKVTNQWGDVEYIDTSKNDYFIEVYNNTIYEVDKKTMIGEWKFPNNKSRTEVSDEFYKFEVRELFDDSFEFVEVG